MRRFIFLDVTYCQDLWKVCFPKIQKNMCNQNRDYLLCKVAGSLLVLGSLALIMKYTSQFLWRSVVYPTQFRLFLVNDWRTLLSKVMVDKRHSSLFNSLFFILRTPSKKPFLMQRIFVLVFIRLRVICIIRFKLSCPSLALRKISFPKVEPIRKVSQLSYRLLDCP